MSVRDEAVAAYEGRRAAERAMVESQEAVKARTRRAEAEWLLALVLDSDLAVWFPGAEWEAYAVPSDSHWHAMRGLRGGGRVVHLRGVVCADRPEGTDPDYAGVPCFGIGPLEPGRDGAPDGGAPDRAPVFLVRQSHSGGYTSWEGPEVRSLEHLGELIVSREAAVRASVRDRLRYECACLRSGGDVMDPALPCAMRAEHAVIYEGAGTVLSRQDVDRLRSEARARR